MQHQIEQEPSQLPVDLASIDTYGRLNPTAKASIESSAVENQIATSTTIVCTQCGSDRHIKHTKCNGIHKCRCMNCLYLFTPWSTDDMWLVGDLGLKFHPHERRGEGVVNFKPIEQEWLKDASKKFIKYRANTGVSLSTLSHHLLGLKDFSAFLRSHPHIHCFEDISRSLIVKYIEYNQSRGLRSQAKNTRLASIASIFEIGNVNNWFVVDPYLIRKDDYAKLESTPLPRYLPTEVIRELNQHLDSLPEPVMRMVLVTQECGLRVGELCQLPLDCLKQDSRGGWFIQFMRLKTHRETTLPISLELAQVIKNQQEYIQQYLGINYQYLFCARKFRTKDFIPMPSVMLRQAFIGHLNNLAAQFEICDRMGKRWNFQSHQFRHTVGTSMINNGVPQHIIQRFLGHSSPSMTSVYAHIHDDTLRQEVDKYLGTKVVNINGEVLQSLATELDDDSSLQWLKKKILAETLPNGYCGLPAQLTCNKGNACLTCSDFRTTREFLDRHKQQLERTNQVLEVVEANGWERQIQVNQDVKTNLEKIITVLEAEQDV
jgi:integrase/recombinase XerD